MTPLHSLQQHCCTVSDLPVDGGPAIEKPSFLAVTLWLLEEKREVRPNHLTGGELEVSDGVTNRRHRDRTRASTRGLDICNARGPSTP